MRANRFSLYAAGVLAFMVLVILWGAIVRHTGSGAGCGNHWPTCNGEVVPHPERVQTIIEFTHRATSGLSLLLVLGLVVGAFRTYARGSIVRRTAVAGLVFTLVSAALGAAFVKMGWVEGDNSAGRAIALSIHLANTLLLVGALALTVFYASGAELPRWGDRKGLTGLLFAALVGTLLMGVSGAVTSLGDTLYPASGSSEVLQLAMSPTQHFLVKLRIYHPMIAVVAGVLVVLAMLAAAARRPAPGVRRMATFTVAMVVVQLAVGVLAVVLRAPTWMAIVHLALADALWISQVLATARALGEAPAPAESVAPAGQPVGAG